MMKKIIILFMLLMTGCANAVHRETSSIMDWVGAADFELITIPTARFDLTALGPPINSDAIRFLSIYIEGDGHAWISRSRISPDPTPKDPIALKLMLVHPNVNAAYLARPCQYVRGDKARNCLNGYWTSKRFSVEVLESMNSAVSALKERYNASQVELIGYSGGGAIATLLASRRTDVSRVITVAGNLDHRKWTQKKKLTPLSGSENPADYAGGLGDLPQLHFVGARDAIMGPDIAASYFANLPVPHKATIDVIKEFDHWCCWVDDWKRLYPSFE